MNEKKRFMRGLRQRVGRCCNLHLDAGAIPPGDPGRFRLALASREALEDYVEEEYDKLVEEIVILDREVS